MADKKDDKKKLDVKKIVKEEKVDKNVEIPKHDFYRG